MTTISSSLRVTPPPDGPSRSALAGTASEAANTLAKQIAQAITSSLRVPEESRAIASTTALTESITRAQKLMALTHPPAPMAAVPSSAASASAEDSASNFNSERQAQERRLQAFALMRLLELNGARPTQPLKGPEPGVALSQATLADKSYRAMQALDSPSQSAMARARQLGLRVSVLA